MPEEIFCRNCNILIMVIYHRKKSKEQELDENMLEYCSDYCFTAIESPEDLKYFDKPEWM